MKPKVNPQAVLLVLTGMLFTAGIFFIGFTTNSQIRSATSEVDSFASQVESLSQSMKDAQDAYASAIQSEKDMINWRARKAAGVSVPSGESSEESSEESSDSKSSVFSQNTSPEYNSFAEESSDIESQTSDNATETNGNSEADFSDQPVA